MIQNYGITFSRLSFIFWVICFWPFDVSDVLLQDHVVWHRLHDLLLWSWTLLEGAWETYWQGFGHAMYWCPLSECSFCSPQTKTLVSKSGWESRLVHSHERNQGMTHGWLWISCIIINNTVCMWATLQWLCFRTMETRLICVTVKTYFKKNEIMEVMQENDVLA